MASELESNAKALLQQPENAALHFGVGLLYARVGDFGSSAKMLNIALNLTGNNETVLGALAYLYASQVGDHKIALTYLKKLHKLDRKKVSTVLLMAHSLLQLKKPDDAIAILRKTRTDAPHQIQLNFLVAQAHIQREEISEAKAIIDTLKQGSNSTAEPMVEILEKQIELATTN